jgi:uncharacterized membrane protein YkvA (DUF1232 family)
MTRSRLRVLPEAYTLVRLAFDGRTPRRARVLVAAFLAYLLVPTDLLPDVVLGLGLLDDLAVGLAVRRLVLGAVPGAVLDDHRRAARERTALVGGVALLAVLVAGVTLWWALGPGGV